MVAEPKRIPICRHLSPEGWADSHTLRKMFADAISYRKFDTQWGVVNPGNALCVGLFRTLREAEAYRRGYASKYVTVRVCVTPDYGAEYER